MTLRFMDGYEAESFITHAQRKYASVTNGWGTAVAGRTNSAHRAIRDPDMILVTDPLVGSLGNTWTVGIGYRMFTSPSAPGSVTRAPGIRLLDGPSETADEQVSIEFQPQTKLASELGRALIVIRRGATVLATGTTNLIIGRWYYVEATFVVRTGTNGSVVVRVYDQTHHAVIAELNVSGINTANQGSDGADRVAFLWDSVGTAIDSVDFDDAYVADDSTMRADHGWAVECIESTAGNGDTAQWSLAGGATSVGNALLDQQNNSQASFEDRRITSDTIGQLSLAPFGDLAWIKDGTISGVLVITLAKMDTSGTRTIANVFRHKNTGSPSNAQGGNIVLSSTTFDDFLEVFAVNPVTSSAWLPADLNLGQWGVIVVA